MQIENHIKNLKKYIKDDEIIEKDGSDFANFCKGHIDDIQAVLNELEKKDKIINEMAEYLDIEDVTETFCVEQENKDCLVDCKNCIKEYFTNKVEKIPEQN